MVYLIGTFCTLTRRQRKEQSVQWGHLTLCGRKLLCLAPPRVHCALWVCTAGCNFLGNISVVSFLGHTRCKWFQGFFKGTLFANNIQFMQNLNQFCFCKWNTKKHVPLLNLAHNRVPYLAHSMSNMLRLSVPGISVVTQETVLWKG